MDLKSGRDWYQRIWSVRTEQRYSALEDAAWTVDEKDERSGDASPAPVPPPVAGIRGIPHSGHLLLASMFVNLGLLLTLLALTSYYWRPPPSDYSFSTGYRTELAPARKYIEIEEKRFDGTGEFDAEGHMVLRGKDDMQYIGEPSPELDEAWESLTNDRYFMLSEDEAREAWPNDDISEFWDPINGGYVAGLDVFHVLHCVGQVRQSYYPEYYGHKGSIHSWHCLEAIRQYIMCNADLTPIPTRFYTSRNTTYIESDLVHTCRNFDRLQDFLEERRTGPSAVMPLYHPYTSETGTTGHGEGSSE